MALRDYQNAALSAIRKDYESGWRQIVVSMPCGTGKTQVFSHLPEFMKDLLPLRTLVLAHRSELLDQAIEKIKAANPTLSVSKEMGGDVADVNADVIVASTATLGRAGTKRADRFDWASIDKILTDECHHGTSPTYASIYERAGVSVPDTKKLHVGFTATPQRSDGTALATVYKKLSYIYGLRTAIEAGWLVKIRGYRVVTSTDISEVGTTAGDFNLADLETTVNTPERNKRIVEAWQEKGGTRPTVVFAAGVEHAKTLSEAFTVAGVASEAIWGDDPERTQKLQDFRDGKILVIVNCSILTEGVDLPLIGCVVIARPTKSGVLFTQMVGRGTRLHPGKEDCIILDVLDSCGHHSIQSLPSLMGMPGPLDLKGYSITDAVKLIEDMQEAHDNVDFTKLKDITAIKQFIEEVNLFEVRFPPEVENSSELRWCRAVDGGYMMKIARPTLDSTGTKAGRVRIYQNMLNQWEICGNIKDREFLGIRDSVEEAFACADQQIRERSPESMSLLNRKAGWTNKPVTKAQMTLLSRLYGKGKQWPEDLTQGQASYWIDRRIGGK